MKLLSDDYEPFGMFALGVFIITLIGMIAGVVIMSMFGVGFGLMLLGGVPSCIFFAWGMLKQYRELTKRVQLK